MEDLKMENYRAPRTKIPFHSDKEFHVFLSFRGKDVRMTLVDHLYEALTAAGLNVFLDTHKLKRGEIIGWSLERAVDSSAVRIPIFSQGYANSAWCLKEAARMLTTPGLIIPLFYKVDPTHIRYPEGNSSPYKQAFEKHHARPERFQNGEIEGWKDALLQICSRSGWSLDVTGGFEAQLVKMVVNDVIKTFDRVQLQVAKHPVGIESMTEDLIHKFRLNSDGGVIKAGLWGIGGIGKTTLAKAVYNKISSKFEAASFVFNVRATAVDSRGLTNLQKKILIDLVKYDGEVASVEEGISLFEHHLRQKRVLVILDDVDAEDQCKALIADWLAPGSTVIITSRDKHILHLAGVSSQCIREIRGLQINESLQLFSWHAFLRTSPTPGRENLSKSIVEACKGHPLSLEVIGSFLYDKQNDPDCWTEAFHNIILHPDIHERLKISYTTLSEDEKEIFLDIACFFIGENKTIPLIFWKSLYRMVHTAIANLSLKLLIKIDDDGVLDMHDHLRDMGRSIAEKEREGTRLWNEVQLSRGVSNCNNFSRLRLNGVNSQGLEALYGLSLQFLHLQNVPIAGITPGMLPPSLIWLRLQNRRKKSHSSLVRKLWRFAIQRPFRVSLVDNIWELRIMQVHGNISNIQYSLSKVLGKLSLLTHLELRDCRKLNKLPQTIGNLSQLKHLELSSCRKLNKLPQTIGNLSQLKHLDLRSCRNLNKLPQTIGNLLQLKHLVLEECIKINKLPQTIGNLSQLSHLDLGWCINLNNLPDTIGNLSQLQHLYLKGCRIINNLSDNFGNLSQLQHLDLEWCTNNNLPDTIGNLSQLRHLDLGHCRNLNNLPDTVGNLSQMDHLYLRECRNLNNLPNTIGNLSQLSHLDLKKCTNLDNLPDTIGNLSQLQHLDLGWCTNLNNLPDSIGNLSQLQHLDLRGCTNLNNLPDSIGNLSQLQHLDLGQCTNLNNLPDSIGNLSQLQHLDLGRCTNLNNLPHSIGNLSQLQHLDLGRCTNLNNLPDTIGNLSQLQHLDLGLCKNLNNLLDTIGNLSQLQHLDLGWCTNLYNLPDTIGNLSQLQHLDLERCTNLNNLPDIIGNLSQLQHLHLQQCKNLNNLPDTIGNLSQLQHLDLGWCTNLNNFPDTIGNLSQLQHLDLRWCTNLTSLPDTINNLSQLNHLYF